MAAATHLLKKGESLVLSDQRTQAQIQNSASWVSLKALEEMHSGRVEWALGGHPLELLERCDRVVVSPGASLHLEFLQEARKRGVRLVGEMELAWQATSVPLIAVTGTNGKSTTCSLLGGILGSRGVVGGNIGVPLLHLAETAAPGVDWMVAEVSSFQLETVHDFRPRIGVLTNITPDHLDHHKDLEEYRVAKSRLFAQMEASDTAIFCLDDPVARQVMADLRKGELPDWISGFPKPKNGTSPKIIGYSSLAFPEERDIDVLGFTLDSDSQRWVTRCSDGVMEKLFPWDFRGLPGKAMMSNGLAAIASALAAGVDLQIIQDGLRRFQPLRYRMEFSGEIQGVQFINDSKATNISSALASARAFDGELAVIVGGKDKGVDYQELADGLSERGCRSFLIGEATEPIVRCFDRIGYENFERSETLELALPAASNFVKSGGTVLLAPACSSFDQFKSAEHRGQVFSDLVAAMIEKGTED